MKLSPLIETKKTAFDFGSSARTWTRCVSHCLSWLVWLSPLGFSHQYRPPQTSVCPTRHRYRWSSHCITLEIPLPPTGPTHPFLVCPYCKRLKTNTQEDLGVRPLHFSPTPHSLLSVHPQQQPIRRLALTAAGLRGITGTLCSAGQISRVLCAHGYGPRHRLQQYTWFRPQHWLRHRSECHYWCKCGWVRVCVHTIQPVRGLGLRWSTARILAWTIRKWRHKQRATW